MECWVEAAKDRTLLEQQILTFLSPFPQHQTCFNRLQYTGALAWGTFYFLSHIFFHSSAWLKLNTYIYIWKKRDIYREMDIQISSTYIYIHIHIYIARYKKEDLSIYMYLPSFTLFFPKLQLNMKDITSQGEVSENIKKQTKPPNK